MEWFYRQRAYPREELPAGARGKALEQLEAMRRAARERRGLAAAEAEAIAASTTMWTPIGPQPSDSAAFGLNAGRVSALAVDPTDFNRVYLGGAQGGVWKTTNGGITWAPLTDDQPSLAIGALAIDPSSCTPAPCTTIYAGTGEQVFSLDAYYGAGILKSTDGGASWQTLGQGVFAGPLNAIVGGARISSLAVHPTDRNILLAGVQKFVNLSGGISSGIYRSADGGATWTQVLAGAVGTEVVFARDPASQQVLAYAALGSHRATGVSGNSDPDNGVYKSTDGGATWTRLPGSGANVLPTANAGRIEIAVAPSNPNTVYAGIQDSSSADFGSLLGFFKTTDGGQNWTRLANTPDYCTDQCWYDHVVRVHPNNANVVYAGGAASAANNQAIYLARSTDGGATWTSIVTGSNGVTPHVDQHAFAFGFTATTAVRLYIGNDGGVWSADVTNPTAPLNWTNLNATLALTQFYPGHSFHPSSEDVGIGGTQDNGTQKYTGALTWDVVTCGDGGWTAIDPAVPSTVYATCQDIDIRKSYHDGNRGSFAPADTGINFADRGEFIPPLVLDPNIPQRLYFGTFRVYQTNDGAQSWAAISPDLPGGAEDLTAIAVAPGDSNVVYAGASSGRVFVNLNAGAGTGASGSWVQVSAGLPSRFLTQLAVDPLVAATAYATFSGFGQCSGCDALGHVFKTANGGNTWADISGTNVGAPPGCGALPDTPANDLVLDPDLPATLYLATDIGVFASANDGLHWCPLVTGLPRVAVLSLKLRRASRTLRAATHGRSVWDLQLPDARTFFLRSLAPVTASAGASAPLTLTVNGAGFSGSSVVRWNGASLATSPVSASQLTAVVPPANLAAAAVAQITVFDAAQVPDTSNALAFSVTGPAPTTSSITPASAAAGSAAFTLTVDGANFSSRSTVRFNGADRPTTLVSATRLTAQIPASDVAVGGVFGVTVFNAPPGGGPSNAQSFTVTGPPPPNDNFAAAINIAGTAFSDAQNTVGATTEAGDPTPPSSCFPFGTQGLANNGRAKSIWYRFTAASAATLAADTSGSAYDTILSVWTGAPGSFTSVACNDDVDPGNIRHSQLSFPGTAGTTYFFMITAFEGDGGATSFHFSLVVPPPNDNVASARVVSAVPFTDMVNTAAATTESTDPAPTCASGAANSGRAKSVWYRFTAAASGTTTADTFTASYDTILAAFTGAPGTFSEVACNDDTGGLQSQVQFNVAAGTTYHLMAADFEGVGGALVVHLSSTAAPAADYSVEVSPAAVSVARGQSASATVTLTPFSGFSAAVALTCSGLPSRSTCSFAPASVTPASGPATSTLTLSTTAGAAAPPPPRGPFRAPLPRSGILAAALAAVLLGLRAWTSARARRAATAALVVGMVLILLQAACGGGGGNGSPPADTGTPRGTYSVTITGTAGSTTRTATLTLTVN